MKRLLSLVLSAVMLIGLLAGCGNNSEPTPGQSADAPPSNTSGTQSTDSATPSTPAKDTITFGYTSEPPVLSTTGNNSVSGYYLAFMIYSGLFKYAANEKGWDYDLCTEYHIEKDANGEETIWVFKIREGVKFSDGSDLTAEDVAASLMAAHEAPTSAPMTKFFTNVEAVDDYTVKMTTDGVYSNVVPSLCYKGCYILPAELLASGHDFDNNPVGSGPYKLVEWNRGENLLLTINENYYDEEHFPTIKNINWRIIAEGTSRSISLEAGEIDFAVDVASLDISRLQANEDITVSISDGAMFTYLMINGTKAPFDDVNFRKFLACAINRENIVAVAVDGFGAPLVGLINTNMAGATDENAENYNPEKAKEYLAAWGGDPSSVNFEVLISNDSRRRIAECIQSDLLEYGVNMTITQVESSTCGKLAKSGEYESIVYSYTTNDFFTFTNNLYYVDDSYQAGNKFRMSYDDSLNVMLDEIRALIDEEARVKKITEFVTQLNAKQPLIPIYRNQMLLAYNSDLSGVEVDSQGYFRVEDFHWN